MTKTQKLVWAAVSFVLAGLCPTILAVGGEIGWFHEPMLPWIIHEFPHHPPFVLMLYGPQYFLYWALIFFAGYVSIRLFNRRHRSD